jgi:hypothetical protein
MMKTPRIFITWVLTGALAAALCVAVVPNAALSAESPEIQQYHNPRAGDPDEPVSGPYQIAIDENSDPLNSSLQTSGESLSASAPSRRYSFWELLLRLFLTLSWSW